MASAEKVYNNIRISDNPEAYVRGGLHPVHLGDVLNGRYHIFRKLGAGGQGTVWLARDSNATTRIYVTVKVFSASCSDAEIELDKLLNPGVIHPGRKHVEITYDSFIIKGPNGSHFCKVLEPFGNSLKWVLYNAVDARWSLMDPESSSQKVPEGDQWSCKLAKRVCHQILLGLSYLHDQRLAHRDIHSDNVCLALDYDLSQLSMNEIQRDVWKWHVSTEEPTGEEPTNREGTIDEGLSDVETDARGPQVSAEGLSSKDEGTGDTASPGKASTHAVSGLLGLEGLEHDEIQEESSDDESTASDIAYREELRLAATEKKRRADEIWNRFDPGDSHADSLSLEWNRANFFNSRRSIDLMERRDGKPLKSDEIQYIVLTTALEDRESAVLTESTRVILIDLGFARAFEQCERYPIETVPNFLPPEALLDIPVTYKADIFSLGLLFWYIIMLRQLVEEITANNPDPKSSYKRLLRDLVSRLGPLPPELRAHWPDSADYIDEAGNALDMQEVDGEEYDEDSFEYGDIWHHARLRKPNNMSDEELEIFMDLVQSMLRFEPDLRPSTAELLEHKWFKNI